jgi:hypothetical protein
MPTTASHPTMKFPLRPLLVAASLVSAGAPVFGAVAWDETLHGDLSGTFSSPTGLALVSGTNSLHATSGSGGDLDFFTFTLPGGMTLTSLTLVSYSSIDGTAFVGMQSGTMFTEAPGGITADELLGYTHFGTAPGNVGTDILDDIGNGAGAMGFTPPLASGSYVFWIQQAGGVATTYQMNFEVIPEPGTVALLAGATALAAAILRRRRQNRRRGPLS